MMKTRYPQFFSRFYELIYHQMRDINFRIEWEEEDKEKVEEWDTALRFFFRFELKHLMERSDFEEYQIWGDYQGNKVEKGAKEFILIRHKAQGKRQK